MIWSLVCAGPAPTLLSDRPLCPLPHQGAGLPGAGPGTSGAASPGPGSGTSESCQPIRGGALDYWPLMGLYCLDHGGVRRLGRGQSSGECGDVQSQDRAVERSAQHDGWLQSGSIVTLTSILCSSQERSRGRCAGRVPLCRWRLEHGPLLLLNREVTRPD